MVFSQTRTRLPRNCTNRINGSLLYIFYYPPPLNTRQFLTCHHTLRSTSRPLHTAIIIIGSNIQPGIASRPQRQCGVIEIHDIRLVFIYQIHCTIVKILTILHTWIPRIPIPRHPWIRLMILYIQFLWVKTFPPCANPIGNGEVTIVRHPSHLTFRIGTTRCPIPYPSMRRMYTHPKRKSFGTGGFLPHINDIFLRTYVYRVPFMISAVPKVKVVVMIGHRHEIARTNPFIQFH